MGNTEDDGYDDNVYNDKSYSIWTAFSKQLIAKSAIQDWIAEEEKEDEPKEKAKPTPNYKKIADAVMRELVANGIEDMILIKNDDVREWWGDIVAEEKRKAEAEARKERERQKKLEDIKALKALMERLTPEEKRLLKMKEAK